MDAREQREKDIKILCELLATIEDKSDEEIALIDRLIEELKQSCW